jgi:hypothetical protein
MNREDVTHLDKERQQRLERIMNALDGAFARIADVMDAAEQRLIQIKARRTRKREEHKAAAA